MSSSGRLSLQGDVPKNFGVVDENFYLGEVVSIDDDTDAMRIKVKINGQNLDNKLSNDELPWCSPFLPKFLSVMPRVGETVKVILYDRKNPYKNREWLGPIISQPHKMNFDPHFFSSRSGTDFQVVPLEQAISKNPDVINRPNWQLFPKTDVSIFGRDNSDLIIRDSEVLLRAGKYYPTTNKNIKPADFKINTKNPGYISVKFYKKNNTNLSNSEQRKQGNELGLNEDTSVTNIVSDKINLITHKGSNAKGVGKTESIIDTVEINNSNEKKLHPLIYGDVMWEFMSILKEYVQSHVHPYNGLPPDPSISTAKLLKWFSENMGSKPPTTNSDGTSSIGEIVDCTFLSSGVKTN